MIVYLFTEKNYEPTSWCGEILKGIKLEIRRKKGRIIKLNSSNQIETENISKNATVFIIGSSSEWLQKKIIEINTLGLNPILLCNSQQSRLQGSYSYVSSDIFGTLKSAFSIMKESGKSNIALYGINPDSFADSLRQKAYLDCGGNPKDIYFNYGSLEEMFESFIASEYDGVICANDFIAVSLLNKLKQRKIDYNKYYIISCVDSILCETFCPKISAFKVNFSSFGKAGISAFEVFSKNPKISNLNIHICYDFVNRETTKGALINSSYKYIYTPIQSTSTFYKKGDAELREIMAVESFLRNLEQSDILILKELKSLSSYENISDKTYLSLSAVKYRIKNMLKSLNVSSPIEMLKILEKYYSI